MDHGELSRKTLCEGWQGVLAAKQSPESMPGGAEQKQLERTRWWAWPPCCLFQWASWMAALKGAWEPFVPWWSVVQVKAQGHSACSIGGRQPKLLGLFRHVQSSLGKHFQVTPQKQQTNVSIRVLGCKQQTEFVIEEKGKLTERIQTC